MKSENTFLFGKTNYYLIGAGLVLIALGYLLMMGGGAENPEEFNPEIFSAQRISIAPILLVLGFIVEIVAIMWHPEKGKSTTEETAE